MNPYTPNAGAPPPALVGRDTELEGFEILLERLRRGYAEQSMLITGLRGVGKTVLLGAFESRARASGWVTVTAEITKNEDFGPRMGSTIRRAEISDSSRLSLDTPSRSQSRGMRHPSSFDSPVRADERVGSERVGRCYRSSQRTRGPDPPRAPGRPRWRALVSGT
jgi:hypothetical protein